MKTSASVEEFIAECGDWAEAMAVLRDLFLSSGLSETIKWGGPVYTFEDKNIVGMAAFKTYAGIWFYQGALLKDEKKKLVNAQEGVTKALRQWRFGSTKEIRSQSQTIVEYIAEAIINQQQGNEIKASKNKPVTIPAELEEVFAADPVLKSCFDLLSLTNRRDYAEYITTAKRPETRQERLKKIVPMILRVEGMNDKYKK